MRHLVILDDGHGLIDTPGKRTPLFPDGTFMTENEFSSIVIDKIYNLSKKYMDIDVIFTASEKRDVSLSQRVERVNNIYEDVKEFYDIIVLVSVHANAMKDYWNDIGNGTATFHYPNNMVDKKFAEVIQKNLIAKTKLKPHRGGVVAENFQIIREVMCTACLCECAFMDNLAEAKLLLTDEFRQACAEGIINGLKEYFGINDEEVEMDNKISYKLYSDGTRELKGKPKQLNDKIVNQSNRSIEEPNCVNGSFFYPDGKGSLYSTSILIIDGVIYHNEANHFYDFGTPQSVFIVYKDGKVDMKRVNFATELDYKNIKVAVGGVGLRNTLDANFRYSPVTEGFKKGYRLQDGKWVDYTDVLQKRNKTVVGYNKTNNKVYLLTKESISHGSLINLISDNSTGEAYDIALSLDGGGSTFMNNLTDMVLYGDGRKIHNILYFD